MLNCIFNIILIVQVTEFFTNNDYLANCIDYIDLINFYVFLFLSHAYFINYNLCDMYRPYLRLHIEICTREKTDENFT